MEPEANADIKGKLAIGMAMEVGGNQWTHCTLMKMMVVDS
jgi:hypothetical protein